MDNKFVQILIGVGVAALILFCMILLMQPAPAHAFERNTFNDPFHNNYTIRHKPRRHFVRRKMHSTPWRRPEERRDNRFYGKCFDGDIEVLSTEHQTKEKAQAVAIKMWKARVQWSVGGQYMDVDNARDVRWRCSTSNAMDTVSGEISQATQQLIGRDGENMRCQLIAVPCRADMELNEEQRHEK